MYYTKKEREEYNHWRDYVCQQLGITKNQYNYYRRLGYQLQRQNELLCNGNIDTDEYQISTAEIEKKIENSLKKHNLNLYFHHQPDPREYALYLSTHPITEYNYSQYGFAIY